MAHAFPCRWLLATLLFLKKNARERQQLYFSDQASQCMILQHLPQRAFYQGLSEFLQNTPYQLTEYLVHGIACVREVKGSSQQDANKKHSY